MSELFYDATIDASYHHTVNWLLDNPENAVENFVLYNVMLLGKVEDSTSASVLGEALHLLGPWLDPGKLLLDKQLTKGCLGH